MLPKSSFSKWLPTPGSIIFTLLIAAILLYTQRVNALSGLTASQTPSATSTTTLPYQGRLTDTGGNPINATKAITFRLYNVASGGTALWQEAWPTVNVSDGLFNVLLGSITPIPENAISENDNLWLGIMVETDTEMTPRVQVGSVPYAMRAALVKETNYELSLTEFYSTTTSMSIDFGTIDLPTASNLHIASMWVVENADSGLGISARLEIDGIPQSIYSDAIPFSSQGIGFPIARNHFIENISPGLHMISVWIGQFPYRSGDLIFLGPDSTIWIRAVPTTP